MAALPPCIPTPQRRSKNLRRASSKSSFWLGHLSPDLLLFDPDILLFVEVLEDLLGVFGADFAPVPECLAAGRFPGVAGLAAEANCLFGAVGEELAAVLPGESLEVRKGLAASVAPDAVGDLLLGEEELMAKLAEVEEDLFFVQFAQKLAVIGVRVVETLHLEGNLRWSDLGEEGDGMGIERALGGHGVFDSEGIAGGASLFCVEEALCQRGLDDEGPRYRLGGGGYEGGERVAGLHLLGLYSNDEEV